MTPIEPGTPKGCDNAVSTLAAHQPPAIGPDGRGSVPLDAGETTDRRPPFSASKSTVERAYEEYHRLLEEGAQLDIEAYCARFPSCRSALLRLLQVDLFVGDHPEYVHAERKQVLWPVVGEQRGDLTMLRPLGRGTFARVFLASEASAGGRLVAVKFSVHGDAEARTLGRLSHPHIVPILSARREEPTGLTMVCMPYLGSSTLQDVLDLVWPARSRVPTGTTEGSAVRPRKAAVILDVLRARAQPEDPPAPLTDPRLRTGSFTAGVIHLALQLAEALAFLHAREVCHRDLKPSNILLDPAGKPLLLDFNLSTSATEGFVPRGATLSYAAPEQLHSFLSERAEALDERADLFALGVIVYELLTGEHPYGPLPEDLSDRTLADLLMLRQKSGFRPLRCVCADLERPVAAVLDRCLAVDPAQRPRSAAELSAELKRQFTASRRLRRWLAGRPRTVAATLSLLLAAAVAAGHAWSVAPPYSEREHQRGETAYRAGDYDEAERHFDRALQADPGKPRLRWARGCARLKQSKYQPGDNDKLDQAWGDLKPADETLDARTLAVKAYIESRRQNVPKAIELYNRIPAGYRPIMVMNNRAYSYILRKNFSGARNDLDAAARLDPNCQAVFYNRAMLALNEGLRPPKPPISTQALDDIELRRPLGTDHRSALSRRRPPLRSGRNR